jgi:hypothetical protein
VTHVPDNDAGVSLVKVTGECPFCDVRKHQIDGTLERAQRIVAEALDRHVAEVHPDVTSPGVNAP